MSGYVKNSLKKFNHKPPKRPEHAPHDWTAPIYGQRTQQQATQESTAPLLPSAEKKRVQIIFDNRYFTYVEIGRGMYGLKEAGVIAFDQLIQKIKRFCYEPMPQTPGLWRHTSRKKISHSVSTTSASSTSQKPTPTT